MATLFLVTIEEATRSASEMKREGWDGSLSSSKPNSICIFEISRKLAPLSEVLRVIGIPRQSTTRRNAL